MKYAHILKHKISLQLKQAERVALTTDSWTIKGKKSYLSVMAHFINDNMELIKCCLNVTELEQSATGAYIAEIIGGIMKHYEIQEKVTMMVTDLGSNMISACEILKIDRINCLGSCY